MRTTMRGVDLKQWRQRNGYTQEALMHELKLGSRQTIVGWEQSEEISRTVELALQALERLPDTRLVAGTRFKAGAGRKLTARGLQKLVSGTFEDGRPAVGYRMGRVQPASDPLTGLCNRAGFLAAADTEWKRARTEDGPLSVIMFDIDAFKSINDRFGHPVGDDVLLHVANICRNFGPDTAVAARMGGDEFALLLPGTGLNTALAIAEQLGQRIREFPALVESRTIHLTVSLGIAEKTIQSLDFPAVLQQADKALYAAKNRGRNCAAVFPSESKNVQRIASG
jgi:diguanylate cyclase (GGDEF)-like protein